MAVQAGGKALAASGLSAADIDLVIVATCTLETPDPQRRRHGGPPARHRRPRRVRRQRRLRRVLLRARRRQRRGPRRLGHARARHRRGEAVPVGRLDRPLHRASSSPTARAPRWSAAVRHPRHRPGRLGQRRRQGRRINIKDRNGLPPPGGPGRVPLGHHRAAPGGRARPASAPGVDPAGPRRVRPAPGQPAHHRGHRPQAGAPTRPSSPTTSSTAGNTSAASIPLALSAHDRARRGAVRRAAPCCSASAPA